MVDKKLNYFSRIA